MTVKQPLALKLAKIIETFDESDESLPLEMLQQISNELRRLYKVNKELLDEFKEIIDDHEFCAKKAGYEPRAWAYYDSAQRMVAKVKGETKMTKLDEMWVKLAKYQSKANDNGYGKAWAKMCGLRTVEACLDADYAAANDAAANAAAAAKYAVANAAAAAKYADYAEIRAQEAIDFINQAIELAEKRNG
jgi:hypothetical protein